MRIDGGTEPFGFVARIRTPALPVSDEETLLRRESFERFEGLSLRILLPRHVSQNHSAQIGDIFAERQFSVDLNLVQNYILRILIRDATGALLKRFGIVRRPPVAQITVGVKLAAFVIKAVRKFVADRRASIAEVRRRIRIHVEQWRLQNSRGEIDVV